MIEFTKRIGVISTNATAEVTGSGHTIVLAVKTLSGLGFLIRPKVNQAILAEIPKAYDPKMDPKANIEITIPGNIDSLSVNLDFGL